MDDPTTPASKADIKELEVKIHSLIDAWSVELKQEMQAHHEATTQHMDLLFENHVADLRGATKDEFSSFIDRHRDHERRLIRLEDHYGFTAKPAA